MYSPWGIPNGYRLNHLHTRDLVVMDGDKHVTLQVTYKADGSFDVTVPGAVAPISARGTLDGSTLSAFIADELIEATVVVHEYDVQIFYKGKNATVFAAFFATIFATFFVRPRELV